MLPPAEQLQLSEVQLNEEITKMLNANDPSAPSNIARYSNQERMYKFDALVNQRVTHYTSNGWVVHKLSEEARRQIELEKLEVRLGPRQAGGRTCTTGEFFRCGLIVLTSGVCFGLRCSSAGRAGAPQRASSPAFAGCSASSTLLQPCRVSDSAPLEGAPKRIAVRLPDVP